MLETFTHGAVTLVHEALEARCCRCCACPGYHPPDLLAVSHARSALVCRDRVSYFSVCFCLVVRFVNHVRRTVAEDGGGLRMSADARALLMQRLAGESLPAPPPLPGSAGGAPGGVTPPQQVGVDPGYIAPRQQASQP